MMSTSRVFALGLVVLFGAWCLVSSIGTSTASAASSQQQSPSPRPSPARPIGGPAIVPHLKGAVPSFTAADAAQFATTQRMWRNLAADSPRVVRVAFLTSAQVSALLGGESTGLADDALLCYVELSGTFTFATPQGTMVTYTKGVEVFDAQTGNLLIAGGSV